MTSLFSWMTTTISLFLSGLDGVATMTQRLEIGVIEEQPSIPSVRDDVIYMEVIERAASLT